ncbi:MAG: response regulator [Bacteroidota bacterium]|jgi:PleD family two-component response regulator
MQWSTASDTVSVDNPYRRAKVEHYVERVEELVRMARYSAAKKALSTVFMLEPNSKAGSALQKHIDSALAELLSMATPSFTTTNGQTRQLRRGELVLVVDQDERILTSLTDTLRKYGFGAIGAGSFDEAVEALSKFKPGLIISEVNFENGPVGYDLYLWVRHNEQLSSTPFLYLLTRVTREMLIAGKRMGVDEFIVKPIDEEVVMASILNCLARRKRHVA